MHNGVRMSAEELSELIDDQCIDLETLEYREMERALAFDVLLSDDANTRMLEEGKRRNRMVRPIVQRRVEMRNATLLKSKYDKDEVQLWMSQIKPQPGGKVRLEAANGWILLDAPELEIVAGPPRETRWEEVVTVGRFMTSSRWRERGTA